MSNNVVMKFLPSPLASSFLVLVAELKQWLIYPGIVLCK